MVSLFIDIKNSRGNIMSHYSIAFVLLIASQIGANYVNINSTKPGRVRFYPKNSVFRKSDLIDRGCIVFIKDCPAAYKRNIVCARHYDGYYRTFNNYCEMEYDNCNSWRQWSMIKRERC